VVGSYKALIDCVLPIAYCEWQAHAMLLSAVMLSIGLG